MSEHLGQDPVLHAEMQCAKMAELLAQHMVNVQGLNDSVTELAHGLSVRLPHWQAGKDESSRSFQMRVFSGPHAAASALRVTREWHSAAGTTDASFSGMFPGIEPDLSAAMATLVATVAYTAHPARVILDPDTAHATIDQLRVAGIRVKLKADISRAFWVSGHSVLALPQKPGSGHTNGPVLLVHSAAIAGLVGSLIDTHWRTASEVQARRNDRPWDALLTLLFQGFTVAAASQELGLSPRTGHRRVTAAMEFYRVKTLFALGHAWGHSLNRAQVHALKPDRAMHPISGLPHASSPLIRGGAHVE